MKRKKILWIFLVLCALVGIIILLQGCGSNIPTAPSLTAEEKALLRRYGLSEEKVVRWPNGYVDVYDKTGVTENIQAVIEYWNSLIGGSTVFRLSNNPESPVRVYFDSSLGFSLAHSSVHINDEGCIDAAEIAINPAYDVDMSLLLSIPMDVVGVNGIAITEDYGHTNLDDPNIQDLVQRVVRAMYRVPPGYPLN